MRRRGSFNWRIRVSFIFSIAGILLLTVGLIWAFTAIFRETGLIGGDETVWYFVLATLSSVVIGSGVATLFVRSILQPIEQLVRGLTRLSRGDYAARIDLGKNDSAKKVSQGFNNLAKELENTELLRTDFINNFSHEFKTPIASVSGLIELLKRDNISAAKRKEYLNVIEEEINRLLNMSTNVLNLSKVDSLSVLKDVEQFNLSEQIRTCIVLLKKRWERKKLSLRLDFGEFDTRGNVDLLKNVWINLLENAIKFADERSELCVDVERTDEGLAVSVQNTGVPISAEDQAKIFHKFYQADTTHSREGNGIGLSIVKRIVELHQGEVSVSCNGALTTFTVLLPLLEE